MRIRVNRRSRLGIAQVWLIAGGVAAAGLLGYVAYKYFKNRQNPTSYSQYAPQQQGYGQYPQQNQFPQAQFQQAPGKGGFAFAPQTESRSREGMGEDPELTRLFQAEQSAQQRFASAMASGDGGGAARARESLKEAQAALQAKKQSMY